MFVIYCTFYVQDTISKGNTKIKQKYIKHTCQRFNKYKENPLFRQALDPSCMFKLTKTMDQNWVNYIDKVLENSLGALDLVQSLGPSGEKPISFKGNESSAPQIFYDISEEF